ncbi:hypothetical protein Tco_1072231 [Tanacetum coccineum]
MAEPQSLDHVFDFPEEEFEDSDMELEDEFKNDPEEDLEEEKEANDEEDVPLVVALPVGSPITQPPLSESSLDSEPATPVTNDGTAWVPPSGSTFKCSVFRARDESRETEIATTRSGVDRAGRRIDAFDVDVGFIKRDTTRTSDNVLALQEGRASD